jgi:hypothetical protein
VEPAIEKERAFSGDSDPPEEVRDRSYATIT